MSSIFKRYLKNIAFDHFLVKAKSGWRAFCGALSALAAICVLALAIRAEELPPDTPIFSLPVDCPMGTDVPGECTIHKYVDHDPSPSRKDFACGRLSLDGDTGTDFRTPSFVEMREGVNVLAAADGTVRAVRDGMDDVSVRETGLEAVRGREAGNSVAIQHGAGWETQYSHLKKGSVKVTGGDRVKRGQVLGEIGLSGRTEFPHVEFSVRKNGAPVDPFVGPDAVYQGNNASVEDPAPFDCAQSFTPLWTEAALQKLAYRASGVLSLGMANSAVDTDAARHGAYDERRFSVTSPALVVWADIFGAQAGDEQDFKIIGPNEMPVHTHVNKIEKNNISWFTYSGKRRPEGGWPAGSYRASYTLKRDGEIVAKRDIKFEVKP